MLTSLLAVIGGGSVGCALRWILAMGLNMMFPAIPPGTLVANLVGGYLIGVALAYFGAHPELPPQWRLFVITGFLGGFTTFSSFSGEVVNLLRQDRILMACAEITIHLGGSLLLTFVGMATVSLLRSR